MAELIVFYGMFSELECTVLAILLSSYGDGGFTFSITVQLSVAVWFITIGYRIT